MTTKNLVPRATGEGSLGTSAKKWGSIYADNIVLQDGETLATKISSQNSRITTAEGTVTSMEGTVTTLSGDVTSLYSSVDELSSGKANVGDCYTKTQSDTLLGAKANFGSGFPSDTYVEIPHLDVTGEYVEAFTAPANGWIVVLNEANVEVGLYRMVARVVNNNDDCLAAFESDTEVKYCAFTLPISRGNKLKWYAGASIGNWLTCRFYYNQGEVAE